MPMSTLLIFDQSLQPRKKGYKGTMRKTSWEEMKSGYSHEWISTKAEQDEKLLAIFILEYNESGEWGRYAI